MITLMSGKSRKFLALLCMVMIMSSMFVYTTVSAYATATDGGVMSELADPVNKGLESIFNTTRVIATAIAMVVAGFTGVKMLMGDARAMETGKATIFKIIAAVAIIWLAPLLIKTIIGLFKGVGGDNNWAGALSDAAQS